MTSSPSLTSNNFIITHHLNTLHNNVGNYFEFICMKTSLTMFDNSDTFENFFLFRCYKLSSVNHHQQTFSFMVNNNFIMIINKLFHSWSTTTSKNFFIHDHQQQLHDHQQTFSSSTKNFFIYGQQQQFHSPLPDTDILTGRTHSVVDTTFVGQLVRTMLVRHRTITDTPRRVVNHPRFILHRCTPSITRRHIKCLDTRISYNSVRRCHIRCRWILTDT